MAAGFKMPTKGTIFISVNDYHKDKITPVAKSFQNMGFKIMATKGTAKYLKDHGIEAGLVFKVSEGRPHIVDYIKNGDIQMVINTSIGHKSSRDAYHIRRSALIYNILYTTTIAARAHCAKQYPQSKKRPGRFVHCRSIKIFSNLSPLPLVTCRL